MADVSEEHCVELEAADSAESAQGVHAEGERERGRERKREGEGEKGKREG